MKIEHVAIYTRDIEALRLLLHQIFPGDIERSLRESCKRISLVFPLLLRGGETRADADGIDSQLP